MNTEHPQDDCELDFETLVETCELECKLAQGAGGKGELPKDFWRTYSGMANAKGGVVLLGVKENKGQFSVAGIENIEKVKQDLFNQLNNPSKVSSNLLSEDDVVTLNQDGKQFLRINIPAATRKQKPVFINNDLYAGTYLRLHDGDRQCDQETVKRMVAEQIEDERDARILKGFTFDDLDIDSISAYRNLFSAAKPGHPWLDLSPFDLVKKLRGWRKDRESGEEGITLAGLLMFGQWEAIQEGAPHYVVDYQERPEAKAERRWVDRIFPDGSWSGNLFDFYRRVYRKLIADLKVQFTLTEGQRLEDSPAHVALREALVNSLVHADYSANVSVLIVKRPDMFGFRNPGLMRIPHELALQGSHSDCRNRILHQMFLMIGLGERAGSGIPKIFSGWKSNLWTQPRLREVELPEQTLLELHMADIIPSIAITKLSERLGNNVSSLTSLEQLILYYTDVEGWINHERAREVTAAHPRDVTLVLSKLVRHGLLHAAGSYKSKVYCLSDVHLMSPDDEFGQRLIADEYLHDLSTPEFSQELSQEFSQEFSQESSHELGHELTHDFNDSDIPMNANDRQAIENIRRTLGVFFWQRVEDLSLSYQKLPKHQADREVTRQYIMDMCQFGFLTLQQISQLLGRKPASLRRDYLTPMVSDGLLETAFPHIKNHPKQGYRTVVHNVMEMEDTLGDDEK
ncbi:RNA-binding domain-containing protein [Aeromonas hydrophila]|uniref:RNA-binding domain-containing protein n=1 Tax=Aeromonas hydrophila TaxID=644 RepID=UPI003D2155EF